MIDLVGRDAELAALQLLIDRSHRAPARFAAIVGAPGTGKSSLLAAVSVRQRSYLVRGYVVERRIPFAAVGSMLQQLGDGSPAISPLGPFGVHAEPVALFDAVYRAATRRPTAVVIDDAQWVDERSRTLLHFVFRTAVAEGRPLCLVAASRPDPSGVAFLQTLAGLVGEDPVELELGPLSPDDGAALARRLRPQLTLGEAADLAAKAQGSPYWISSLIHDRGRGIAGRLDGLDPDAVETLAALAIASRPTRRDVLESVLTWPKGRLDSAISHLVAGGLALDRRADVTVSHDLVREEVESSLPAALARSLRLRFAQALSGADDPGIEALQLAFQHRRAAGVSASDLARRLLDEPDRTLIGVEGLEQLVAELADEPAPWQRRLGELAMVLGDYATAKQRFLVAAGRSGSSQDEASAVLDAAWATHLARDPDETMTLLARARSAEADRATLVAADVLEAAVARWSRHDHRRARELTERALAAVPASEANSPTWRPIRQAAIEGAHDDATIADDVPELVRLSRLRVTLAVGLDERLETRTTMVAAFLANGQLGEALELADGLLDEARDAGRPRVVQAVASCRARALFELGRVGAADEAIQEAVVLERRVGPRPGARRAAALALGIRLSTGDWAAALASLQENQAAEPDPHFRLSPLQLEMIARSMFGSIDHGELDALIARGSGYVEAADCPRCGAEFDLHVVEALVRTGQASRAVAAWDRARRGLRDPWLEHHGRRAEALTATATSVDGAAERVVDLADEADSRSWSRVATWTRLELGRLLSVREDTAAVAILSRAQRDAEAGGARNEAALAERWLRGFGERTWRRGPVPSAGDGGPLGSLTPREREVARRVACGATNPEIAASLFLSRKTIERHVSSVLAKLGVRNRTELAAVIRDLGHEVEGAPS